jgi:hypothetical protein
MGVVVQVLAPYSHNMLGKAESPWRTVRDNASAMLPNMAVPNFMWSCIVITVVYLRNPSYNRCIGLTVGVPITLLTSTPPDASKFRIFGCTIFAKVPDKLRRKLSEKAFRGVMVGYPHDAPWYRVYNPKTRRITTSVHVVFQGHTIGFGARFSVDSVITYASDTDDPQDTSSKSHPLALLPLTQSRYSSPILLMLPTAHLASGLTPSATGILWHTCLITRHSLSRHVVT